MQRRGLALCVSLSPHVCMLDISPYLGGMLPRVQRAWTRGEHDETYIRAAELRASLAAPAEDIAPVFARQVRPSWGDMSISAPLLIAPFHSTLLAAPSLCPPRRGARITLTPRSVLSRTLVAPRTCLDVVLPRGSPALDKGVGGAFMCAFTKKL